MQEKTSIRCGISSRRAVLHSCRFNNIRLVDVMVGYKINTGFHGSLFCQIQKVKNVPLSFPPLCSQATLLVELKKQSTFIFPFSKTPRWDKSTAMEQARSQTKKEQSCLQILRSLIRGLPL